MARSIFIDIAENEINTYLFEAKGGGYVISESKKYLLPAKYDFSLDAVPEDIENAYVSLPMSYLNFRLIELPFSGNDRIREILPFELDGVILGGAESVVFDSLVIGPLGDKYQVLAVYIEKVSMRKLLETLRSCGIDPVFVTSIELRPALKDFNLTKLLSPAGLEEEDRTALALEEVKAPSINLRKDEFLYTRDIKRTRKSLRVTTVLLILIALILAGDAAFKIISTRTEIAAIKNDVRKQYQEIFPGEKNVMNELYQLKSHMKELTGKEGLFVGVKPLDLLDKLSQIDRQGTVINEFSVDKANITIKGETQSLGDIQQLQNKLKNAFDDVNISDSKASAQGRMLFTITAKEKKS